MTTFGRSQYNIKAVFAVAISELTDLIVHFSLSYMYKRISGPAVTERLVRNFSHTPTWIPVYTMPCVADMNTIMDSEAS